MNYPFGFSCVTERLDSEKRSEVERANSAEDDGGAGEDCSQLPRYHSSGERDP